MNSSTRLALILGLQIAAGAAFVACGGDDPAEEGTPGPTTDPKTDGKVTGTLAFQSTPLYSAFVEGGMHEAKVPVILKDPSQRGKGAKFTSMDTAVATVEDTADGAMVTIKKDGSVTIKGELGEDSGNVKINIKKYTEAEWTAGQARYSKPELAIKTMGNAAPSAISLLNPMNREPNGACNTCHTSQAKVLKIENGPQQIAGYSDDDLVTIFTMGKKPEGASVKTMIPAFLWGTIHAWTVTDAEKPGLIAFLRTQAPKPNPNPIDYGVKSCDGSPLPTMPTAGQMVMLCDNNGNPINLRPGADAGTPTTTTPATDAGGTTTTTTPDAGTPSTGGDAG
jgi:hypothetical protein